MKTKRYTTAPFPSYQFTPGKNIHPEKSGGHMEGLEIQADLLNLQSPKASQTFCFGIDLFNHQFFWESHVYWEAQWNMHNRKGKEADLLKALIKYSAAGVKFNLNHPIPAIGHINRGLDLLNLYDWNFEYIEEFKNVGKTWLKNGGEHLPHLLLD